MARPLAPWSIVAALLLVLGLAVGCVPDPQRAVAATVLDQLSQAQADLRASPADAAQACDRAGDARITLFSDAGPADAPGAWVALRRANSALMATCGQLQLLGFPSAGVSVRGEQARERWQQGAERQLGAMCGHLRQAAVELRRPPPDCR